MYARPIRNLSRCWSFAGLLLFGVATSQPASAVDSRDYDIRGMKLGQTVEEIKASMAKLIPGATVHEVFWTEEPGFEKATKVLWVGVGINEADVVKYAKAKYDYDRDFRLIKSYIPNMGEYIQVMFSQVSSQAYLITQWVRRETMDKAVTFDNLVTKLIEKYGEPTSYGGFGKNYPRWVFKDNGERNDNKNTCFSGILIYYDLEEDFNNDFSGCGISLAAEISGSPIVYSYQVSLVNHAAVLKDKKERDFRKQEQERRKEKEMVEKHHGNDPKL